MAAAPGRIKVSGLEWIDRLKGVAMLWVVLNHIVEQLAGGNFAGDPTGTWPPLAERIRQFQLPVTGLGPLDVPLTALRDGGWLADQAVSIFIILSGFGLTLGLIASRANAKIDAPQFFGRRLQRIYPYWWGAHILFLPTGYLFASGLSTGDWHFYASFAGLRFLPQTFYYFASSWWYVGVVIQLYVAFPLLWWIMRARGPLVLLALSGTAGFATLAFGHATFHGELVEMWQRGIFAVVRWPEFAFGMVLAQWWAHDPSRGRATFRRPQVRIVALAAYAAAFAASFTLPGMIVAPTVLGIGAIVLLYPLVAAGASGRGPLEFVGRHSFTIYLTHQYFVQQFVRPQLAPPAIAVAIVAALLATALATIVLERGTSFVQRAATRPSGRVALGALALGIVGLPIVAELTLRASAFPDTSRFSERVALRPDDAFDWSMIPLRTIRVHGRADYRLESNAAGFPAPDFPIRDASSMQRVFVLGDAVSSAGVDTDATWPRLLEGELARMHRPTAVANFAVSGYGPNQEALVARAYTPRYRPGVVIVEVYPDDVQDVLTDAATLRKEIGLDSPAPDDARSVLALKRLRRFLPTLLEPVADRLTHTSAKEYDRGQFVYLERGHDDWDHEAIGASAERYREIAAAAAAVGARTLLVFIPAPAQVCDSHSLAYYPQGVRLSDAALYDRDLPNRRAARSAAAAHLPLLDLSERLRARHDCPYGPNDRYLNPQAHRAIAEVLARWLSAAFDSKRALQAPERQVRINGA